MTKISDIVKNIIESDETALEAMRKKILNLSSYAELIRPQIEKKLYKKVKVGTIVVALIRYSNTLSKEDSLVPEAHITSLSIRSTLSEYVFDKTDNVLNELSKFENKSYLDQEFFAVTVGLSEIGIIISSSLGKNVLDHFSVKPKYIYINLVAVTVKFTPYYLEVPNVIHTFVRSLAVLRINIIEIISTHTEISFVVNKEDTDKTMESLSQFLDK